METIKRNLSDEIARLSGEQLQETLLDAYDILGVAPDDSVEMIKDIYRKKSMHYHPDHGGDPEKFKRLKSAYELVMKSRGQNP